MTHMPTALGLTASLAAALTVAASAAHADDMKMAAVSLIGPLLPVLYNCTPGQPPKFSR